MGEFEKLLLLVKPMALLHSRGITRRKTEGGNMYSANVSVAKYRQKSHCLQKQLNIHQRCSYM